jgi:lipopolysaccharide/colanic/teichoic acid biosynthesis glycosyltransferase
VERRRGSDLQPSRGDAPVRESWIGRTIDIAIAALAVLFAAPLLIALAAAIYLQDGGAPVFAQSRVGLGGRRFRCLKFRTMVVNSNERLEQLLASNPAAREEWERDQKLRDDPRITPLGRFLRKSSLDELPQLFNVLAGDMAIVGPRPIVEAEVHRYGRRFRDYCAVRPGITGLWQVSGRNDVSYRRRVAMDVAYTRSKCLRLDMKILLATVPVVLMRQGSY